MSSCRRLSLLRLASILFSFGVGATISSASSSAAALPDQTLVFCSEGSPAGFDSAQYTTGLEFSAASYTVYNRLVEFEHGGTKVEPGLAETWEISSDGLTYTFHLRHGVKFHTTSFFKPTREFNADDVVLTFDRMFDSNNAFRNAYPVQFPYFKDMGLDKSIWKIEELDPYTVRFTMKTVTAPFLSELAMPFASIISAEYADSLMKAGKASDINLYPVGTGPFIFVSYTKDATIRFDGHPDYWKPGVVRVSKLIFSITPDAAVREQKLKENECQVMNYPRPQAIASLESDSQLQVPHQVGFDLGYLGYNTTHKPLDKDMLAKAGFPDGFEITLWAMPVQRPYNPNARLMAEMIQADWEKIGVHAKIVTYEWGEYIKRAHAGEHDAILIGWTGDNGDPDNWLGVLLGCSSVNGSNYSKWCYQPFETLIQKGRATTDVSFRTDYYTQAQEIFKQQVPFTPIAHSTVYQPMRKNVTGFKIDPFGPTQFWNVGMK